jgi:hypothetical protein
VRKLLDPSPAVTLDGRVVRSTTRVGSVSAYEVVFTTVLPDRGIELHSSYIGHDAVERSHVTHLLLARDEQRIETRELAQREVPVVWARRRCLDDHLWRLGEFLRDLGWLDASIDVVDEVLSAVET